MFWFVFAIALIIFTLFPFAIYQAIKRIKTEPKEKLIKRAIIMVVVILASMGLFTIGLFYLGGSFGETPSSWELIKETREYLKISYGSDAQIKEVSCRGYTVLTEEPKSGYAITEYVVNSESGAFKVHFNNYKENKKLKFEKLEDHKKHDPFKKE